MDMRLNLFSAVALALVANLIPHRQPKARSSSAPRQPEPPPTKPQPSPTYRSA